MRPASDTGIPTHVGPGTGSKSSKTNCRSMSTNRPKRRPAPAAVKAPKTAAAAAAMRPSSTRGVFRATGTGRRILLTVAVSLVLAASPSSPLMGTAAATAVRSENDDAAEAPGAGAAAGAGAPGAALFDALDSDRDGVISPHDWDVSLARMTAALNVDLDAARNLMLQGQDGLNGDEQRTVARDGARRDGLTGDLRVPRNRAGGASFDPSAGAPSRGRSSYGTGTKSDKSTKKKLSFTKAFTASVAMILATEIGDKTFFIAAVLSMRNDRLAVFGGAILALIVMTVLSTMMGLILPSILPRKYTHIIGGILFLYFGIKLVLDSRSMEDNKVSDELEEVEEELLHTRGKKDEEDVVNTVNGGGVGGVGGSDIGGDTSASESDLEGGGVGATAGPMSNGSASLASSSRNTNRRKKKQPPPPRKSTSGLAGATAYKSSSFQATFLQSLTLTFLAEWGDRSQIATIALAAAKDPLGVTVGGCLGHCMCTSLAVVGGRMLAARISEKTVSFYGGIIFFVFGVHSMFFES
eukprot:CAMPEP_0178654856 /NCGR_PEP_ID=MMETSP0698-20121128/23977_1 /TAXON_ID=265572 /ORGANISM="Extubocellulus spinifer, Strain CCMP396" /LENGTH=523 /DNA_ID=CAMNT_0020296799 /DNA_START=12 /DNA_END=1583 /DNA_ORIENTATION=-